MMEKSRGLLGLFVGTHLRRCENRPQGGSSSIQPIENLEIQYIYSATPSLIAVATPIADNSIA